MKGSHTDAGIFMQFTGHLNDFPIKQNHIFSAISCVVGNCYLAFAGDLKGLSSEVHAAAIRSGVAGNFAAVQDHLCGVVAVAPDAVHTTAISGAIAGNLAAVHFKFSGLSQKYTSAELVSVGF